MFGQISAQIARKPTIFCTAVFRQEDFQIYFLIINYIQNLLYSYTTGNMNSGNSHFLDFSGRKQEFRQALYL